MQTALFADTLNPLHMPDAKGYLAYLNDMTNPCYLMSSGIMGLMLLAHIQQVYGGKFK